MITALSILLGVALVVCVMLAHTARKARSSRDKLLGECASLEHRLDEMTAKYENEVDHRKWAITNLKERTDELKALRNNEHDRTAKKNSGKR